MFKLQQRVRQEVCHDVTSMELQEGGLFQWKHIPSPGAIKNYTKKSNSSMALHAVFSEIRNVTSSTVVSLGSQDSINDQIQIHVFDDSEGNLNNYVLNNDLNDVPPDGALDGEQYNVPSLKNLLHPNWVASYNKGSDMCTLKRHGSL